MSLDLYEYRLYWDGSDGCVKVPGMLRHLLMTPSIPGLPALRAVDFGPETGTRTIHPANGEERGMTDAEAAAALDYLICQEAQAARMGITTDSPAGFATVRILPYCQESE